VGTYQQRVVDQELTGALRRAGATLIEGPRACGKTETALQAAASVVHLDRDSAMRELIDVDLSLILAGETPRLIDEWQIAPELWNAVRGEVDTRQATGQFILTGSTAPATDLTRHTGAGRFARVRMRTMTHWEMGWSNGGVSLKDLMNGETPRATAPDVSFGQLTQRLTQGGWPGFRSLSAVDASANLADYLDTVATVDLRMADGVNRDPLRVRRLLTALARSVGREATITTLARDETSLTRDSVRDYLSALERIFIVEDQPAWSTHLRSSATLRKEPKRHFADPSLAVAALNASPQALQRDPAFTGQLFESLVVHDLRVFSQPLRGTVSHTRDSAGREVDAIVSLPNGDWAGFEVKLGSSKETLDAAAVSLLNFAQQVVNAPVSLNVITLTGPSYRRRDGVNVIAFNALCP